MEKYRALFTLADVALIVAAAFFASRAIFAVLAPPPEPVRPSVGSEVRKGLTAGDRSGADTGAILARNLFGSRVEGPAVPPAGLSDEDMENLPESTLPLKLLGTVVQLQGRRSFAIIQDTGTREQALYFAGEEIREGVLMVSVSRNRVVLIRNGQEEVLEKDEEDTSAPAERVASKSPRIRTPSVSAEPSGEINVRKVGDNDFVMDRREVEGVLQDFNKLLTQIRVVPHFADGQPDGFKIFNIRPGSLFAQLGMVNGDIIKRVNGLEISGPEQALQMFQQLRDESRVTVDLERFRKNITLQYDIR